MNIHVLFILLVLLIFLSIFFSAAETGMMAINRYRLRHQFRKGNAAAKRVTQLLERPDRLLGVILIGNTFANILATAIATMIALHYFGNLGVLLSTLFLTLIILIFAETAPKTFAVIHPEAVAFSTSWLLGLLLKILYPLVWLVNTLANAFLYLFRVRVRERTMEPLSVEELRTVVFEASGKISSSYQQMLLRVLDLESVTIDDVMVPRNEIYGIDLDVEWSMILNQLTNSPHAQVPLYRDTIDNVVGILKLRKILSARQYESLTKQELLHLADKVYFIPEGALLNRQLLNFQDQQKMMGLVVDEYGDIQGLVTLQDILEEIVGAFSRGMDEGSRYIKKQKDGTVLVDGKMSIRDLNRTMHWELPTDGPRTLSGLVVEYLEMIPQHGICVRVAGYPMEIMEMSGNKVRFMKIIPQNISHQSW